jgi:succinoglycan biosynthesis transport protein ExoP
MIKDCVLAIPFSKEGSFQFKEYLWLFLRRKWVVITTFFAVVLVTMFVTFRQTPMYRASTTLIIEPQYPKVLDLNDVIQSNARDDYYNTQYQIIQSYAIAQDVFRLCYPDSFEAWQAGVKAATSSGKRVLDDPVENLRTRIKVLTIPNSRLVQVYLDDPKPREACRLVNAIAEAYVRHNLEDRLSTSKDAVNWLSEQLEVLKAELELSENNLLKYMEQEKILGIGEKQDMVEMKLQDLNERYTETHIERLEKEALLNDVKDLLNRGEMIEAVPKIMENPLIQELKKTYFELEIEVSRLSSQYKDDYPKLVRLRSQMAQMKERLHTEVQKLVESLDMEYQVLCAREQALEKAVEKQKNEALGVSKKAIQYNILKREADTDRQMYELVLQRLKETDLAGNIQANNIRIIDEAKVPQDPVRPRKKVNAVLSMIVGLMLGLSAALGVEYFDTTIKSRDDLEHHISQPILGVIPSFQNRGSHSQQELIAECFRTLRTNLRFLLPDTKFKAFVVTSSQAGEGKSTIVYHLGRYFADAGIKVLIVDGDLRFPSLEKMFQVEKSLGLADIFLSSNGYQQMILSTEVKHLSLMPSGTLPSNPSELLGSEIMRNFVESVRKEYDLVLIDSPPVLSVSDSLVLASLVENVLLVVRQGKATYPTVRKAISQLEQVKAKVAGVIFNDIDLKTEGYYGRYYHYYGSHHTDTARETS